MLGKLRLYWTLIKGYQTALLLATGLAGYMSARCPVFSLPTLGRLISSDHDIVAVYTQPDKPTGRGRKLIPPPVKEVAQEQGIMVVQPVTLRNKAEVERLAAFNPDAIIVVAFGQILPQEVLDKIYSGNALKMVPLEKEM